MTKIKYSLQKDGGNKKEDEPEVVVEPLVEKKKAALAPARLQITFTPAQRSRTCFNLCLLMIALLVLAGGVVGVVYLYKYLTHQHHIHREHIRLPIHKQGAQSAQTKGTTIQEYTFEEDVEIDIDSNLERMIVPTFEDFRSSLVMHDFFRNYTAIVDRSDSECYVMKLDQSKVNPPKNLFDLLYKYKSGYYWPNLKRVTDNYRVITPELTDLDFLGPFIKSECKDYTTYKMEKLEKPHFELICKTFGYSDLKNLIRDRIYK